MDILVTIEDKEEVLIFSNDLLDNDNFVELKIGELDIEVGIDELNAAIKAFMQLREDRLKRDKLY